MRLSFATALCALVAVTTDAFVARPTSSALLRRIRPSTARSGPLFGAIEEVTEDQFDDVLECGQPVMVKFFADWCGPCKVMEPRVAEVAETYEGKLKVVKVDIDSARGLVKKYSLRGLPYIAIFKDGEKVDGIEGAIGKEKVVDLVKKNTGL
jgi:thioredoxin 1